MLSDSEVQQLMQELNAVKNEIRDLKNNLSAKDRKKEDLFRERKRLGSEIHSKIKNATSHRDKRNSLTSIVKNTKLSREELEKKYGELDAEIKTLKDEKRKVLDKIGVEDPIMLKKNIKKLEYKIETDAMSFEKEKELMKTLSKMRKQLEKASEITVIDKKLDGFFREFRDVKAQLEMHTKIVQNSAKESQKQHVEMVENSKDIDGLKEKESTLDEQIGKIKAEMAEINGQIDNKVEVLNGIKTKLSENNIQLKEDVEKSKQEILKQKDSQVQEKLKTGKKLTTEDLLILQRTMR